MNEAELLKKLREAFRMEAEERLSNASTKLLELERADDSSEQQELLEVLFREAHSLKGAARAVNLLNIENMCQAMESVFSAMKRGDVLPDTAVIDILHQAMGLLERVLGAPQKKQGEAFKEEIEDLISQLARVKDEAGKSGKAVRKPKKSPSRKTARSKGRSKAEKPEKGESAPDKPTPAAQADAEKVPDTVESPAAAPPPPTESAPEAEKAPGAPRPVHGTPPALGTVRLSTSKLDSILLKAEEMVSLKLSGSQHLSNLRRGMLLIELWNKKWVKHAADFRAMRKELQKSGRLAGADQLPSTFIDLLEFLDWNENHITSLGKEMGTLITSSEMGQRSLGNMVDALLETMKAVTMLPVSTSLDLFPRMVREIAREQGKVVDLHLRGGEIEIDRRILEEMKDPLIHLLRNSIDHGLEEPDERERLGKPRGGTIRVTVSQVDGNTVEILVADDGRGIDLNRVKRDALARGHITRQESETMGEKEAKSLIFRSGVSTSRQVTHLSGRGLGLAIVQEKVDTLGGHLFLETKPGEGSAFTIRLPVTLATFRGLLVRASGGTFIIPSTHVYLVLRISSGEVKTVESRATIALDGQAVALVDLCDVLRMGRQADDEEIPFVNVVVLETADKKIAFRVDEVLSEQEVLVKGLGKQLSRVPNVTGATILGSGKVVPVLNVHDMMKSASTTTAAVLPSAVPEEAPVEEEIDAVTRSILVVEDSITSRMLLKSILESAGFRVKTAVDGLEALTALKSEYFDLVVSDVEMPRMNGLELTEKIRSDAKMADVPVVLVTNLESREDRERGIDAGANAYIGKGSFDQSNLLEVVGRFI